MAWEENTGEMIIRPVARTDARNQTISISPFNIAASPRMRRHPA
jgi:hypothetical protein